MDRARSDAGRCITFVSATRFRDRQVARMGSATVRWITFPGCLRRAGHARRMPMNWRVWPSFVSSGRSQAPIHDSEKSKASSLQP